MEKGTQWGEITSDHNARIPNMYSNYKHKLEVSLYIKKH
jgi:hypothetical protein